MDYEEKANSVADRLLSYRKDESGWKICKKSVSTLFSVFTGLQKHFIYKQEVSDSGVVLHCCVFPV